MTRLGVAVLTLVAACALLVATASTPAAADPPRPTNFRSQVLAMDPPAEGVTVQVEGGDARSLRRTGDGGAGTDRATRWRDDLRGCTLEGNGR